MSYPNQGHHYSPEASAIITDINKPSHRNRLMHLPETMKSSNDR
jgi:hypothetical protein